MAVEKSIMAVEKSSEGTDGGSVMAVEKSIMAVEKSTVRGQTVVL